MILDVPFIEQRESYDCGAAAAAAVLRFWRWPLPSLHGWPNSVDGTDPRILEAVLRGAGLGVQSGEGELCDLAHHTRQGRPVICLVQHNGCGHWVVCKGVARGHVYLMCPASGDRRVKAAEFAGLWCDTCRDGTRYHHWLIAAWR